MVLNSKTLEKLRNLINADTTYRSDPKLVIFFNQLGFNDSYDQGFPSRHIYTDDKLQQINGTPELDEILKNKIDIFLKHYKWLSNEDHPSNSRLIKMDESELRPRLDRVFTDIVAYMTTGVKI